MRFADSLTDSVEKIERLTPEQEVKLREFRQEWFEVGTCTNLADQPRAERAITAMYAEIGEAAPNFIWCDSPATCLLAIHLFKRGSLGGSLRDSLWGSLWGSLRDSLRDSLGDSLRDSLWGSLWDSLRDSLRDSLGDSLRDSLWDSLRDSLWGSLWGSLRDSLRDSLGDSLRDSLWGSLGDSLRDSLGESWWGQHEAAWPAFYKFPEQVLGVRYNPKRSGQLDLWAEIARSACWWWPYKNFAIVSERPESVRMEKWRDSERLHCFDGPSLRFRDGWEVYSWHGLRVDERIIRKQFTADEIDQEPNVERRRAMAEIYGEGNYLRDTNAKLVDEDKDSRGNPRKLWRKEQTDDEPIVMVELVDSTPEPDGSHKHYFEGVPPTVTTCREALAWQWEIDPKEWIEAAVET